MEEEKVLDMSGVEEDAAAADQEEQEARNETGNGKYTHTFREPFRWKENEFTELTFDWTTIKGRDYLDIEQELVMKGRTLVSPAFTGDFLTGMAARACTERDGKGKRVIDTQAVMEMNIQDFQSITKKARSFLLRAE